MRAAEKILAILGAVASFGVVLLFALNQAAIPNTRLVDLLPFPLLYFIEIVVICLASTALTLRETWPTGAWQARLPWLCAGILLAFVLLGAWTIGLFLIPAFLAYLATGALAAYRQRAPASPLVGVFSLAALLQAALMLLFVYVN